MGRYGSKFGHGVKIWDAQNGQMVKELPAATASPLFSPDGRWLASNTENGRLWEVGSWQPGLPIVPKDLSVGAFVGAFTQDGKIAVVFHDQRCLVQLIDPETGREYATLESPYPQQASMQFSPDGSQLAVASVDHLIQVWDLRLIRQQLAEMGLDWDLPPFPPASESDGHKPLQVTVLPGEVALVTPEERARQAIEQHRRAVEANPNSAEACNSLAWMYATAPETLRDLNQALALAEKAVQLAPQNPLYGNTLGVVYL